jgi:hypothetical protein
MDPYAALVALWQSDRPGSWSEYCALAAAEAPEEFARARLKSSLLTGAAAMNGGRAQRLFQLELAAKKSFIAAGCAGRFAATGRIVDTDEAIKIVPDMWDGAELDDDMVLKRKHGRDIKVVHIALSTRELPSQVKPGLQRDVDDLYFDRLRSWRQQHGEGCYPPREDDERWAQSLNVSRGRIRALRTQNIPAEKRRGGRPKKPSK